MYTWPLNIGLSQLSRKTTVFHAARKGFKNPSHEKIQLSIIFLTILLSNIFRNWAGFLILDLSLMSFIKIASKILLNMLACSLENQPLTKNCKRSLVWRVLVWSDIDNEMDGLWQSLPLRENLPAPHLLFLSFRCHSNLSIQMSLTVIEKHGLCLPPFKGI